MALMIAVIKHNIQKMFKLVDLGGKAVATVSIVWKFRKCQYMYIIRNLVDSRHRFTIQI